MSSREKNDWLIIQDGFQPEKRDYYESIFSLGNGYMGVRGFLEEDCHREDYELCTYIAGVFDFFKPGITDMVNTPNFLKCSIAVNGTPFEMSAEEVHDFKRVLNIRDGTLERSFIWEDKSGNRTRIESVRFLSMADVHAAVLRYKITPLNYDGRITFETAIDAHVSNNPIHDDQLRNEKNPVVFLREYGNDVVDGRIGYIAVRTRETGYGISEAFSCALSLADGTGNHSDGRRDFPGGRVDPSVKRAELTETFTRNERYIGKKLVFDVSKGTEYIIDKFVSVYTSRDTVEDSLKDRAVLTVKLAEEKGFEGMLEEHRKAWNDKWDISDILIEGDKEDQLSVRYNIFQLIQGNSENDPRVSIGARGIMHGRYKGCYFWDTEIFMLPFFIYTNPKAARNLLMYRYHTLPGARENARNQSVEGARYPWMSSIDGKEQCETWDIGCCEVHITADVAYAVNHYYEVTGDMDFIRDYGAEILIETARYWKSRFTYDPGSGKYNMLFVKGPNEYGGVTLNNTFTTMMAIHNLKLAMATVRQMEGLYPDNWKALKEKIGFEYAEMDVWKDIINKAVINYDEERKLYIEDDNFMKTEPIDVSKIKSGDVPAYRRISFDRLQRYMVVKQADVILLMTLFPDRFSDEEKMAAWNFYEPITLHDSTLSYGTHALFAARMNMKKEAYDYFLKSAKLDLCNIMENTGAEGIHFASLGATWQAVVNGFGGVKTTGGKLGINPSLPEKWNLLKFKIIYRGNTIAVEVAKDAVKVCVEKENNAGKLEHIEILGKKVGIPEDKKIIVKI